MTEKEKMELTNNNESWWETDWFLASLTAIVTLPFLILFYILSCFVMFVRFFREAVWIEYKCFLVIIGEVSGKEAEDEFENRIR